MNNQRRRFIRNSGSILLGATLVPSFMNDLLATPVVSASDRLNVGVIGLNGMGWSNLEAILKVPGTKCIAICDIDKSVLDRREADLAKLNQNVKRYKDYRKMLDNKDIDIVIIGTPDHWHCLQMTDACEAGKHVYVEKPVGNSIAECKVMEAAQEKYNSIVQVGQWQRSSKHFQDALNFVHSGKLGKIRLVRSWAYIGWKGEVPIKPDSAVPSGVDYQSWLGPATARPFNINRFHFNFRWFWDYAGGLMTDWGVHMIDYALLGMKAGFPNYVMASGGKMAFPNDAAETPDTLSAIYEFDDFNLVWEHSIGIALGPYGLANGTAFTGSNGTLILSREGWYVLGENKKMENVPIQKDQGNSLVRHMENFTDAIRKNNASLLNASIQQGSHTAQVCQLGNIAYRTKEKLKWDKTLNAFSDVRANDYLAANYHNGYKLPSL